MRNRTLCVLVLMLVPAVLAAQPEPKSPVASTSTRSHDPTGLPIGQRSFAGQVYVGEPAPGFELSNAHDVRIKLSRYKGERVLLCFADRRETITLYRAAAETLRVMGVRLIGILRDSPRSLRSLAGREGLEFELLSDPTGEISAIYGSYDFPASTIRPGYVLVGRTSTVRMALLGQKLPPEDLVNITRYALVGL
jgi:peroxiredoxin